MVGLAIDEQIYTNALRRFMLNIYLKKKYFLDMVECGAWHDIVIIGA